MVDLLKSEFVLSSDFEEFLSGDVRLPAVYFISYGHTSIYVGYSENVVQRVQESIAQRIEHAGEFDVTIFLCHSASHAQVLEPAMIGHFKPQANGTKVGGLVTSDQLTLIGNICANDIKVFKAAVRWTTGPERAELARMQREKLYRDVLFKLKHLSENPRYRPGEVLETSEEVFNHLRISAHWMEPDIYRPWFAKLMQLAQLSRDEAILWVQTYKLMSYSEWVYARDNFALAGVD